MTTHRDLKQIIRTRQAKTGESYTTARAHVMRARAALLGISEPAQQQTPRIIPRSDAAILKVNDKSARIRLLAEDEVVTFRCRDAWRLAPGQVATLDIRKRWTWRGSAYASGVIEDVWIDVAALGLEPLTLRSVGLVDLRATSEPFREPNPYSRKWRQLTATPRESFKMDPIAWGAFPGSDVEDCPTQDASELIDAGRDDEARALLMDTLLRDLRCIDAHALLGNMVFDRSAERALVHFEVGVRLGDLSFPAGFGGLFEWGRVYNRPFLRCLHGYGLCLWRLGEPSRAQEVFERILSLNPNDNQGIRGCWEDIRAGKVWREQDGLAEALDLMPAPSPLVH